MGKIADRHKLLEERIPEGVIITRKWLVKELGFGKHAIDNLVKSMQLKSLWKGIYIRGNMPIIWQSVVYALQAIEKTDCLVGGVTALDLKGFSHYLPISNKKQTIHLYGNDKLPRWVNELSGKIEFIHHTRNEIFSTMDVIESLKFTSSVNWKDGMDSLIISNPERACLEMLNEVPGNISFEHADQLIQGMTTLSPRTLQKLLEESTNIKVKRLFLWFAKRHNYLWFTKLNPDVIELGAGNRVIIKGGKLDRDYLITVPRNLAD